MSAKIQTMPEDKWQAEDDARTLQRAAEILSDKKRKGRAEEVLKKTMKGMEKLEEMGLKCCMDDED